MSDARRSTPEGIDRATPVIAVLAGAVTVASSEGDWSAFDSFIGALLVALVAGFHHPAPRGRTPRAVLLRLAFGLALSLTLLITLAWPIQTTTGSVDAPLSPVSVAAFTALAVLLAVMEPHLSRLLDAAQQDRQKQDA